ncbi:MAG: questin oxidase family protein [Thermoanaerobaculia bacterium]
MLHSLLADSEQFSASYGGGNANHLAMALVALDRLGASDERLREFASIYQRQLRLKPADEPPLPNGDWKAAIGKRTFETTLAKKFAGDLAENGRDALLHEVVSRLTPGIASEAFHGLIRTAYAVDSGDDADIPNALTSWVIGYGAIGLQGQPRFDSAIDAFMAMNGDERFPKELPGRSITGRIAKIVAIPAFDEYRAPIGKMDLDDLAKIAVLIFLATGDFTVLHLVTACHATRVLKPYLAADAIGHLAIAMLAAYASVGRPDFDAGLQPSSEPDWDTLAARAIPSNDEHDLKLVYSCQQEEQYYGWGLHQMAAARRLDRQ